MTDIWFISDTHFSHEKILTFTNSQGDKIRPMFDNVSQMDDFMITRWNENVKPGDRIYHLGDVGYSGESNRRILPKLNGSKRLILGNHDIVKGDLVSHFGKISMWRIFKEYDFVCTHVPLREDSMFRITFNLHGHIHDNPSPSIRHKNMCVEAINYAPINLDEVLADLSQRRQLISN